MRAVILAYKVQKDRVEAGDLVKRTDGYDELYTVVEVNPRYMRLPDQEDNPYKYFLRSKVNDELMNFSLEELEKYNVAFFDYDKYYKHNKKVMVGFISIGDINYIKSKRAFELDLGFSQLKDIGFDELVGMDFCGEIETVGMVEDSSADTPVMTQIHYFRIDKPKS
jgi:hypothetical protein